MLFKSTDCCSNQVWFFTHCIISKAYTNELENKIARLEEENERLRKLKVNYILILSWWIEETKQKKRKECCFSGPVILDSVEVFLGALKPALKVSRFLV